MEILDELWAFPLPRSRWLGDFLTGELGLVDVGRAGDLMALLMSHPQDWLTARQIFVLIMPHVTPEFGLLTLASCFDGQRPIGDLMARLMLLTIIAWVARVWCCYGRRGADFSDPSC